MNDVEARLTTQADALHFESWLPHRFSWVANEVSRWLYAHYHTRWGISVVGWRIIAILAERSPLSAKDLGQLIGMDAVQVTRSISELVRLRLVSRRVDARDRRRVELRLSAPGRRVYDEVLPHMQQVARVLLDGFSTDEQAQLTAFMDRIQANGRRFFEPEDGS